MKKFIIILTIVLTNIFSVIASPVDSINLREKDRVDLAFYSKDSLAINKEFNFNSLYKYLDLKEEQTSEFYEIHKSIYNTIEFLEDKKENGKKSFNNKMHRDLRDIYYLLDHEQYRKYLKVLNITLYNRHLSQYIS